MDTGPELETCSICLESMTVIEANDDIYKLNCNHSFHRDCITLWLVNNNNCPLCRSSVDPDHRYVDEGIMTEERRQYIESVKKVCLLTAQGLEWLFPSGLNGYSNKANQLLESGRGRELLESAGNEIHQRSIPRNLLLELGLEGLNQFISNGGLQRLASYYDKE